MGKATTGFTRSQVAECVETTFATPRVVERQDVLKALSDRGAPQMPIDPVPTQVRRDTRMTESRALRHYPRERDDQAGWGR